MPENYVDEELVVLEALRSFRGAVTVQAFHNYCYANRRVIDQALPELGGWDTRHNNCYSAKLDKLIEGLIGRGLVKRDPKTLELRCTAGQPVCEC